MNQQMLKKLQKMQREMMQTQREIEESIFSGRAGGIVSVEMTGSKKMVSLTINPDAVDPEDVEILQDTIMAAINDALEAIDTETEERMAPYTQGMPGMPF